MKEQNATKLPQYFEVLRRGFIYWYMVLQNKIIWVVRMCCHKLVNKE